MNIEFCRKLADFIVRPDRQHNFDLTKFMSINPPPVEPPALCDTVACIAGSAYLLHELEQGHSILNAYETFRDGDFNWYETSIPPFEFTPKESSVFRRWCTTDMRESLWHVLPSRVTARQAADLLYFIAATGRIPTHPGEFL